MKLGITTARSVAAAIVTYVLIFVPTRSQSRERDVPNKRQPSTTQATTAPVGKRAYKEQKRKRQEEAMLQRQALRARGQRDPRASRRPATQPQSKPVNPQPFAEDFDSDVAWEQKGNHNGTTSYGWSSSNNLAAAGCAPGEIGGTIHEGELSWFADNVAPGTTLLDLNAPLNASGMGMFTATGPSAAVGWFNSHSDEGGASTIFIGWRQSGDGIHAAIDAGGSSLQQGSPVSLPKGKPFRWTLHYEPTGGANGCGELTFTAGDSSSTLSVTKEQSEAMSASKFDRFGILALPRSNKTSDADRASVLWLDNLVYTKLSGFPTPNPKATAHTRTEFFDADPTGTTFDAVNNIVPREPIKVVEDYGYYPTGGRTGGCVGGKFTQAIGTSYYGYNYGDNKLHFTQKLRSEGWFQVPSYEGRAAHLGWTTKNAKSWHEPSTLGLRFSSIRSKRQGPSINIAPESSLKDFEGHGGAGWGSLLTISAGPQWHHYVIEFDPAGGYGLGTVKVQIDDTSKTYYFGDDKLRHGADIDLFGMWNAKIPAEEGAFSLYLDDVVNTVDGKPDPASNDFNAPPAGWIGCNNNFTAKDNIVRPLHEFGWVKTLPYLDAANGYSPMYTIADRERYCMGGIIYLASFENLNVRRASYGARLSGTLSTLDHFYATGRFKLDWANVDAAELFGWYNSATACDNTLAGKDHSLPEKFLGVAIHGGSNGYCMIPSYRPPGPAEEYLGRPDNPATRVYQDGQWRDFYMEYDPDAAAGKGQFKLQLGSDGALVTRVLPPGAKSGDFNFDHFGLLTMRKGGGKPHAIYFDKLIYTVAP